MRGKIVTAVLAAALGTAAVGAGAAAVIGTTEALPGTTVAGTDVGGMARDELRAQVQRLAEGHSDGSLEVRAADVTAQIPRSLAPVDVDETVDRALSAGRTGAVAAVLGPLLGAAGGETGRAVQLVLDVDERGLDTQLEALAAKVDQEPFPGGIETRGTAVSAVPPRPGRVLEPTADDVVADALQAGRQDPLDLPVAQRAAATTAAEVERVVAQARRALAGPYSLTNDGEALDVGPTEISPLLKAEVLAGRLALSVDVPGLEEIVAKEAREIDRPPTEAGFTIAGAPPVVDDKDDMTWTPQPAQVSVTPSGTGLAVDVAAATARLAELVVAGDRNPRELPMKAAEPELSTAAAQGAGVRTLVGTFTTYFQSGQPRATNIRRIAEIVDGAYIAPGETFSLNDTAGRRTKARGFVADGAIVDGELTDEVGGGVSQFATTLFNAAFFAGLDIKQYKPHSFYISRYPAGRESTVYFDQIDVRFVNDTRHGMVVQTSSTPGSVTVSLYGDNGGRRVTATHGPRQPRSDGGFRIVVTRTTTGGDGVGGRRVFRTSYDPPPKG